MQLPSRCHISAQKKKEQEKGVRIIKKQKINTGYEKTTNKNVPIREKEGKYKQLKFTKSLVLEHKEEVPKYSNSRC